MTQRKYLSQNSFTMSMFSYLSGVIRWYHLENRDKNDPTKVTPMGSICYSIQIWPKEKSLVMPVGGARNEPNTNPFLPPPVGRLKFSW